MASLSARRDTSACLATPLLRLFHEVDGLRARRRRSRPRRRCGRRARREHRRRPTLARARAGDQRDLPSGSKRSSGTQDGTRTLTRASTSSRRLAQRARMTSRRRVPSRFGNACPGRAGAARRDQTPARACPLRCVTAAMRPMNARFERPRRYAGGRYRPALRPAPIQLDRARDGLYRRPGKAAGQTNRCRG